MSPDEARRVEEQARKYDIGFRAHTLAEGPISVELKKANGLWYGYADYNNALLAISSIVNNRIESQEAKGYKPAAESDPNGKDAHEPGAKLDAGKPDLSLLLQFADALTAVAAVGTYGAKKYTRGGWLQVPDGVNRYTAAMLRHTLAGDAPDNDTGMHHAAHAAWNALARLQLMLRRIERETP